MRRPQFTLKTLLWLMAIMAAFFGGMAIQRELYRHRWEYVGKGHWSFGGGDPFEMSADEEGEIGLE